MAELRVKGTGTIKLFENDNTSSVTIASPASLSANKTITLPDADVTLASGTMLATDGSGASLTALNASELGSGTVPAARLPTGSVIQVVSAFDSTPYFTTTSSSLQTTDITATITPSATSSKIFIIMSFNVATADGDASNPITFLRKNVGGGGDEGVMQIDDISGWQQDGQANDYLGPTYLDSPSTTSAIVYYVQLASRDNATTVTVGNYHTAGNKGGSCITLMEIAG